ncbi:Imm30 family immunity protein [Pseudophaeobacter sp.]|uniref:Imm30 family immunity protein n=1 Tax=Pseudophaeobacter sp. TaxID=1971739 RepID=UPI003299A64D
MDVTKSIELLRLELDREDFCIKAFEDILADLAEPNSPRIIQPLLSLFRDDFLFDEAFFSVMHTIENFDHGTYSRELLSGLGALQRASKEWLGILVHRVVNKSECYEFFLVEAKSLGDDESLTALKQAAQEMERSFDTGHGLKLARDLGFQQT